MHALLAAAAAVLAVSVHSPARNPLVPPTACRPGVVAAVGSDAVAWAAVVARGSVVAYRRPGAGRIGRFGRKNVNGLPTIFNVVGVVRDAGCKAAWLRVQLPLRPNGITGFIAPRGVSVERIRTRIVVDLSERRLTFLRDGKKVLASRTAVGAPATPTPVGRYYVNQRFIANDPNGPYGPFALGVSAYSPVLIHWMQGGPVGIHGTNAPWSIGRAVSNGCVRVPNAVIRRLFPATPAGTPVLIRR